MPNRLIRETLIVSSDEDMERLHASIVAGFDPEKNFVILMEKVRDNTGDPFLDERDSMVERILTKAILDKENTTLLCDKLHTSLLDLPETVWQEFGDDWPSYRPSEIESIFKKMTDFLVDNGCRFNVMTVKLD